MFLDPLGFALKEYRRLGPIFRLRALHHNFTVLAGPEANAFAARTADRYLSSSAVWRDFSDEFGAEVGLPGSDGPPHYRLRKILQRAYSRATIAGRFPEAIEICERWLRSYPAGQPVPLVKMMQQIVTDQLGSLLVGRGPADTLDDTILMVRYSLNSALIHQWPMAMLRLPWYRRAKDRVLGFGRGCLAAHAAGEPMRSPLLDDLGAACTADPNFLGPNDRLMAALGPFIAGLDTVANTCAFMLHALLRDPAAYDRVTAESHKFFAGPRDADSLAALPALQGAVWETLRLYPIAPFMFRSVKQPFDFAGYTIPTGTKLLFALPVTHLMHEVFPDPGRFDVDRHAHSDGKHRDTIVGFGVGPHACLGASFAELQIGLVLATLLHHARFALDPKAGTPRITRDPAPTLGRRYTVRLVEQRVPSPLRESA